MKKGLLSLLLIVALTLSMLPAIPVSATGGAWDGVTKTEPALTDGVYQIGSGAELAWFAGYVNEQGALDQGVVTLNAVLTDDIDLGGQPWTPISQISYVTDAYAGTFDGQNHTISNLTINASTANQGLFAFVNGATIKNLKVEGNVTSTNGYVGGIIGRLQTGTVENCSFSGSVTTTGTGTRGYAGGIIGGITAANASVTGCCNTAAVTGSYAGGILGCNNSARNPSTISSCYNTGTITGTTRSAGIAGQLQSGSISYCYNIGSSASGICGFSNASITNCYYLNEETAVPGGTAAGYTKITDPAALLTALNTGSDTRFSEDTAQTNNGYPVLTWQLSSSVVTVPVTQVQITGDPVTGALLTAQAFGADGAGATNAAYQWALSADGQTFTNIEDAVYGTFSIPDTSDYAGRYIRVTVTGDEDSSATANAGPIAKSDALTSSENTRNVQDALSTLSALMADNAIIKKAGAIGLPERCGQCSVSWSSSNPDIISSNGTVTLPRQNITTVTLTAEVTCGAARDSISFDIDIWAQDVDANVYLQKVLDAMQWNFKMLQPVYGEDSNIITKFCNILQDKGYDGVTVTLRSTADHELISPNGRIYYP